MRCTKNSPFVFNNGLTRCLNLLEGARSSPPLIREILANIALCRDLLGPVLKVLTSDDVLRKHGKQKLFQMIMAIWSVFPEIARPNKVFQYISASDNSPLARILLLKTALSLVKRNSELTEIEIEQLVSEIELCFCKHGIEADYLMILILTEVLDIAPGMKGRVHSLLNTISPESSYSLAPAMFRLALKVDFLYKVPAYIFTVCNTALYIRIHTAILIASNLHEKQQVFSLLPKLSDEIITQIQCFIKEKVYSIDYEIKHDRKAPFTHSIILQTIKTILCAEEEPAGIVDSLKTLLNITESTKAV
ncbi:hypothetical protein NERG_02063 [Nematocida ausubeli]|uniref:Uncharacterized protein n=1 Tax=Nematocida ausubeli (strain ATCC PRA-371 / ERTm2) TaxID=1913371 RepID=H8ZEP2_NEMA1|nr:hypothetical protein NERG_02063 [Nematocida ausubeli]KAI5135849.1 hypothetical protein NEAUS06_1676 [Nematocida ausubeli]